MMKLYKSPAVLKEVTVRLEQNLLAASTVKKETKIETAGQQVVEHGFADETVFNTNWE